MLGLSLMHLAWITPKWPFPAVDGARQATVNLMRALARRGARIDLCAIIPEDELEKVDPCVALLECGARSARCVLRPSSKDWRAFARWCGTRGAGPLTLLPYMCAQVKEGCEAFVRESSAPALVCDGLHAAAWVESGIPGWSGTLAYRAHNVESDLWFRSALESHNPIKRGLLLSQGKGVLEVERRVVHAMNVVFPVSANDEEVLARRIGLPRSRVLPIALDVTPLPDQIGEELRILFVGRLDWPPNRDGLRWFLDTVWPRVILSLSRSSRRNDIMKLAVVGSGDSRWIDAYRRLPGVEFLGQVADLSSEYSRSIASIIPVFYGSGTRVKAIESSLYGRTCISTTLGMEGVALTNGSEFIQANSKEDWVQALLSLERERALEMGAAARDRLHRVHQSDFVASQLEESLRHQVSGFAVPAA